MPSCARDWMAYYCWTPKDCANVHSIIPWYKQMNVHPTSTQVLQREIGDGFEKDGNLNVESLRLTWGHCAL